MKSVVNNASGDENEAQGRGVDVVVFPRYDNKSRRRGFDSLEMRCGMRCDAIKGVLTLSGLGSRIAL